MEKAPESVLSSCLVGWLDLRECDNASQLSKRWNRIVGGFNRNGRQSVCVRAGSYQRDLRLISRACPNLHEILIEEDSYLEQISQETINLLGEFRMLKQFKYPNVYGSVSLKPLLSNCSQIISLNLQNYTYKTENLLELIVTNLPLLASLNIMDLVGRQDFSAKDYSNTYISQFYQDPGPIIGITNEELVEFAPRLSNLKRLYISSNRDYQLAKPLLDDAVAAIAALKKLTVLELGSEDRLTDVSLQAIATGCPNLETFILPLSRNYGVPCNELITSQGLKSLALHCRQLSDVNIAGCKQITDEGVRALLMNCPKLRRINFEYNYQITDEGIKELNCPLLSYVNLTSCKLTDEGITALALNCPKLTTVILSGCKLVTGASVKSLALNCTQLSHVALASCELISGEGVKALALNCPQLKHVDLTLCRLISDESVKALALNSRWLNYLCLHGCYLVSDRTIETLASNCPQLTVLNLVNCHLVDQHSVKKLISSCLRLEQVDLFGCYLVTDEVQREIKAICEARYGTGKQPKFCPSILVG